MDISKFSCPSCGGKVFRDEEDADGEEIRIFNTDDMDIPLFAPTWDEEDLWQKHPYYNVECDKGHDSVIFEDTKRIVDLDTFNKIMDKVEEEYLYNTKLKQAKYGLRDVFVVAPSPSAKEVVYTSLVKIEAIGEAATLNEFLKNDPKRFKVWNTEITIAGEVKDG